MLYVSFFFVDIAEFSKISSVNCDLYLFRIIIFRNSNSITNFEFWFRVFHERFVVQNLLKKSLILTSLGDFSLDRLLRQFKVETNCCNLGINFSP